MNVMKDKLHYSLLSLCCVVFCSFLCCRIMAQSSTELKETKYEKHLQSRGLVNILTLDPTIKIDLKYATSDNFTKTVLYDSLFRAFLHPLAAAKLAKGQAYLKQIHPELSLLVYDAVRPLSIQKRMYETVRNTKYASYVANPSRTSLHNYGLAVDLTICDDKGTPLDMGTPFDYFGSAAGINKEDELIAQGVLSKKQVANRALLRKVMVYAGFSPIRGEWWHFNAVSLGEAKRLYNLVE